MAKWSALTTYVATKKANRKYGEIYTSLESAMLEADTSAFFKGVLEWLICELAYEKFAGKNMIKIKYKDLLSKPRNVSKALKKLPYKISVAQVS